MPPKLRGCPPPNGGPDGVVVKAAVNIDRRLKLTANDETSPSSNLAASARSCGVAESSSAETDEAMEQLSMSKYLASLSPLEQRVCSISRDHLESSFDLSRSTGYIAWKSKK